jgi:hypothetical protein
VSFPRYPWLVTASAGAYSSASKILSRHRTEQAAHQSARRFQHARFLAGGTVGQPYITVERADDDEEECGGKP